VELERGMVREEEDEALAYRAGGSKDACEVEKLALFS
jgi:hypothetical protein